MKKSSKGEPNTQRLFCLSVCLSASLTFRYSGVVSEKKSSELFTVDVAGDSEVTRKFLKQTKKALKVDEIIAARSAVPAVPVRKRPGDKTTDGILPKKRQRTDYVSRKELSRLRQVADGRHAENVALTDAVYDVWGVPDSPKAAGADKGGFLPRIAKTKAPKTLAKNPISLTASGKPVPAVPRPRGGFSYNPNFSDYEARFYEEGEKAVASERKRLEAEEADRARQEAAARSAAEAEAAEARADLSEWEEDSPWEGIESGGEEINLRAKRPERKTQAQRNRIQRRKEEERKAKREAAAKRKNGQAERIKSIAREVAEREHAMALERAEMSDGSEEGNEEELRRRQLGKFRLPDKDLELVLPDELQDSLRLLKPEGNLLKDRYRNLLLRGKMESRRRIPFRKQAKKKVTEKWTHKDFELF